MRLTPEQARTIKAAVARYFRPKARVLLSGGLLKSAQPWRGLRELRDRLAHEYLDAPALKATALNCFVAGIDELTGASGSTPHSGLRMPPRGHARPEAIASTTARGGPLAATDPRAHRRP